MSPARDAQERSEAAREAAVRIAEFVVRDLEYPGRPADLLGPGAVRLPEAIDSAALLELVAFVEDAFHVTIEDDEILPETLATVSDIVRLLDDKGALLSPSGS